MSPVDNHSEIPDFLIKLGLVPPCSTEDVKQAYRVKVKAAHPDAGGSIAEFNAIQEAFEKALEYARFRAGRMAWLGSHVEKYAAQQALVEEIQGLGGAVEIEQIDWLQRSFGADFSQIVEKLIGLRLSGPQVGDDAIAHLLSERHLLDGLQWLDLSGSQISDRSVALLASLKSLQRLDMRDTKVHDRMAQLIDASPKLNWIGLPRGSVGLLTRWKMRWGHSGLHFAQAGEKCGKL